MKVRILVSLSVGLIFSWMGSASPQKAKHLKTVRLAEGVYGVFTLPGAGLDSNSGFIVNRTSVWVFDPFDRELAPELLNEIRTITDLPVKRVVISHHHADHAEGAGLFPEAVSIGHINMRKNLLESAGGHDEHRDSPFLTYERTLVFHEDGREIQVLHLGRYHTNGDTLLYLPEEKVVFLGDLLSLGGAGNMREAYLRNGYIKVLKKVEAMDVETIMPGHGSRVASKQDLADCREYITAFVNEVEKQVEAGKSLEEIQESFDLPKYRHLEEWSKFKDSNVRRAYQEIKGKWTDF
jgi:cyclase